ncbi:MAG TPA: DNA recombination protein RmuC [Lunatimonas sp.]|nr:DNA recombination protein RmuC [Lunatimonas sp.]
MELIFFLVALLLFMGLGTLFFFLQKSQHRSESLQEQVRDLQVKHAVLEQEKLHLEEKIKHQKGEWEQMGKKFANEFELLANSIFEEKSRKFSLQNKENIQQLLHPLGKELESFRNKVQETYDKESKERFSLESRVKELAALNQLISEEARNLTNALKGNSKIRGNWGEAILETILQNSGLERNRHYVVQEFLKDNSGGYLLGPDGKKMQPDLTINYPDDRKVIIDSKVSLLSYELFCSSEDDSEQTRALKDHVRAIRTHIDQLSSKQYESYAKVLDFVIMFVPVEAAYITAVQADPNLWEYAYKKRILMISSSNLIAALKMIKDLWVRDDQTKHAVEIANRGGMLYDKFVSFLGTLEDMGKYLERSSDAYSLAMRQLHTGNGNLIGQVEKLRKLGVAAKSQIPEKFIPNTNSDSEENK